ncbi:MAG TPA: site-2 protease family protein [Acidothermaceae bacterium]
MMTIGILAFVVALLVSVMLHEAGHFVTAKLFGMKATQFFVGFGTTLWSRQKGETEYGVKAIPAGGFVKIIGMTPLEDISVEDQPRAFINKPGWQRLIVLVAGSTMHFIIALVLLFIVLLSWPSVVHGASRVVTVENCLSTSTDQSCPAGAAPAPAVGKFKPNDVITAVNGQPVAHGTQQLISLISNAPHGPVAFTVQRAGSTINLVVTPAIVDGKAKVGLELNDARDTKYLRVGFFGAVTGSFHGFGSLFVDSFKALGVVPHEIGQLISHPSEKRQATTGGSGGQVTSVFGVGRYAGEAFRAYGVSGGAETVIEIVASVNIFVGIFNLFPFLPLDGGHVAILGYEKIRNAWRRRRHLIPAGPVDLNKLMPFTYGVLAIIVAVSALILVADIANPVANPFNQ